MSLMDEILRETLDIVRDTLNKTGKHPDSISLPRSRLTEFLDAATGAGMMPKTTEEIEQMRRDALAGKAKVWGVSVVFTPET